MEGKSFILTLSAAICIPIVSVSVRNGAIERKDNTISSEKTSKSELQGDTLYITFAEFLVNGENEQYVKSVMEKIGKKYTTIVASLAGFNFEVLPQDSISTLFLEAVLAENEIRQVEGLDALQIYFYIPSEIVPKFESLLKYLWEGTISGVFSGWKGFVTGVIFESKFFPTPFEICQLYIQTHDYSSGCKGEEQKTSADFGMGNVKKMMEVFGAVFGNDEPTMQMGLSVDHGFQCFSVTVMATTEFLSKVDLILYNGNIRYTEYSNMHSDSCRGFFKGKAYYLVKEML